MYITGVVGSTIHFYGNDGVCVFKYLVTGDDPQKLFSLGVSVINLACGTIISICYLIIYSRTAASARTVQAQDNRVVRKRNKQLQRRISAIVVTDILTMVPFTIVSWLHFGGVVDATQQYALFTIAILPINSVINPLLYESTIVTYIVNAVKYMRPARPVQRLAEDSLRAGIQVRARDGEKGQGGGEEIRMQERAGAGAGNE